MRPVHRQRFGIAGVRRCSLSSAPASSESAGSVAVPSLCSFWRSGSRQSGGRDHRGLWDRHNPRWLRRRRGASASAPEYPPAMYEQLRAAGPPCFVSAQTGAGSTNGEEAPHKRRPTGVRLTGSFPPLGASALRTQRRPRRRASTSVRGPHGGATSGPWKRGADVGSHRRRDRFERAARQNASARRGARSDRNTGR
jgi:hypothetical protein